MPNVPRALAVAAVAGLLALAVGFLASLYIAQAEAEEAKRVSKELEEIAADAKKDRVGKKDSGGTTIARSEEWWRVAPVSEERDADGFEAFFKEDEVGDALAQLALQRVFGPKAGRAFSLPADWDGAYGVDLARRHVVRLVSDRWGPLRQPLRYMELLGWLVFIFGSAGLCWQLRQEIVSRISASRFFRFSAHSIRSIAVRAVVATGLIWVAAVWLWGIVIDWGAEMNELQYVALMFGPPPLLAFAVALVRWAINPNHRSHG